METRSVNAVVNFIKKDTTVEQFYNFVTRDESNFDYDINGAAINGYTALHASCSTGNLPLTKALLKMGAYPNPLSAPGNPPLYFALKTGNRELIKLLIENDAKLIRCDYLTVECEQLLETALENNDVEKAAHLLSQKIIYLGSMIKGGFTPVRRMAVKGHFEMVKLLVAYGGEIIDGDYYRGITTPMAARAANHPEIAEFLENTQRTRYQKLKAEIIYKKYGQLFLLGLFHDKKSALPTAMGGAERDIAREIITADLPLIKNFKA